MCFNHGNGLADPLVPPADACHRIGDHDGVPAVEPASRGPRDATRHTKTAEEPPCSSNIEDSSRPDSLFSEDPILREATEAEIESGGAQAGLEDIEEIILDEEPPLLLRSPLGGRRLSVYSNKLHSLVGTPALEVLQSFLCDPRKKTCCGVPFAILTAFLAPSLPESALGRGGLPLPAHRSRLTRQVVDEADLCSALSLSCVCKSAYSDVAACFEKGVLPSIRRCVSLPMLAHRVLCAYLSTAFEYLQDVQWRFGADGEIAVSGVPMQDDAIRYCSRCLLHEYFMEQELKINDSQKSVWCRLLQLPTKTLAAAMVGREHPIFLNCLAFLRVRLLTALLGLEEPREVGTYGFFQWTDLGYGSPTAEKEAQTDAAVVYISGRVERGRVSRLDSFAPGQHLELVRGSKLLLPLEGPLALQSASGAPSNQARQDDQIPPAAGESSLLRTPLGGGHGGKLYPPFLEKKTRVLPWERLRPVGRAGLAPAPIVSTSALYAPLGAPLFSAQEITPRALERKGRKNGALVDPRFESSVINVERKLKNMRLLPAEIWDAALWKAQFTFQTGRLISKLSYLTESDRLSPLDVVRDLRSFLGTQKPHEELGLPTITTREGLDKVKTFVRQWLRACLAQIRVATWDEDKF